MLEGKKILLGVSGGIAAYKVAFLVRLFIKEGAEVRVIMTKGAEKFVTPLTLATLSKNSVVHSFFYKEKHSTDWNNHIKLALWADYILIAPATANTISKMASGHSDNLLCTVYLSATCPVFIAPAMDLDMYKHASTTDNLNRLKSFGNTVIPPETGELASGLVGEGRMAEPEHIVKVLAAYIRDRLIWKGKTVLITAGPTHEAIDPVRFISNSSSGKMGYEIARVALQKGAKVILVSGPTNCHLEAKNFTKVEVINSEEMYAACMAHYPSADIAILSAAVADFKPKNVELSKIKKQSFSYQIELEPTKDILLELGAQKKKGQILVGFALETDREIENATQKLISKNLDAIVLNSMNDHGAGFSKDTNKITIIDCQKTKYDFPLKDKAQVAEDIIAFIHETFC